MEHVMAELNGRIFEMIEKKLVGLVVASYVVVWSQMAVDSLFLEQRYLADTSWV
jgi:hypothetical protein